jgi:hypothetical protein
VHIEVFVPQIFKAFLLHKGFIVEGQIDLAFLLLAEEVDTEDLLVVFE